MPIINPPGLASAKDSNGNIVGLVNPQGNTFSLRRLPPKNVVLLGDSITGNCNATVNAISVTASIGSTTANVNYAGHNLGVGQQSSISNANQREFNGCWKVASIVDVNNFTVTLDNVATVATATGTVQINRGNTLGSNGYSTWLGNRAIRILNNAGLGGDKVITQTGGATVPGMFTRLQRDVYAYNPDLVIFHGGINDINDVIGGTKTATDVANAILAIINDILSRNIYVLWMPLAPIRSGAAQYTAAGRAAILAVNRQVTASLNGVMGVGIADIYAALVDPTSTTGDLLAANSQDGLHWSSSGAKAAAAAIDVVLAAWGVPKRRLVAGMLDCYANNTGSDQTLANPLMQGSGGTAGTNASGTIPANWKADSGGGGAQSIVMTTPARTVAADGDISGNNGSAAVTFAVNNDLVIFRSFTTYSSQFTTTQWLYGAIDVGWSGFAQLKDLYITVTVTVSAVTYASYSLFINDTANFPQSGRNIFTIPPLFVPSGSITSWTLQCVATGKAADTGTMIAGRAELRAASSLAAAIN